MILERFFSNIACASLLPFTACDVGIRSKARHRLHSASSKPCAPFAHVLGVHSVCVYRSRGGRGPFSSALPRHLPLTRAPRRERGGGRALWGRRGPAPLRLWGGMSRVSRVRWSAASGRLVFRGVRKLYVASAAAGSCPRQHGPVTASSNGAA